METRPGAQVGRWLTTRSLDAIAVLALWWALAQVVSVVLAFTGWNDGDRPVVNAVVSAAVVVVAPAVSVVGYVLDARRAGASFVARLAAGRSPSPAREGGRRGTSTVPQGAAAWVLAVVVDLVSVTVVALVVAAAVSVPVGRAILDVLSRWRPGAGLEAVALAVVVLLAASWIVTAVAYVAVGVRRGATPGTRVADRLRR